MVTCRVHRFRTPTYGRSSDKKKTTANVSAFAGKQRSVLWIPVCMVAERVHPAKKLKRTWVENAKIKSKWKAQQRKRGSPAVQPSEKDDSTKDEETSGSDEEESQDGEKELSRPTEISHTHLTRRNLPTFHSNKDKNFPTDSPSLRDLNKEAYSQSSLHRFKSNPLKRGRGSSVQGRGGGSRGRGQPNMKLRMGAMLEKIKRDLA